MSFHASSFLPVRRRGPQREAGTRRRKTRSETYAKKEFEFRDRSAIEIVLIGSDSLDTVKLTHANYFDGTVAVSKYLAALGLRTLHARGHVVAEK